MPTSICKGSQAVKWQRATAPRPGNPGQLLSHWPKPRAGAPCTECHIPEEKQTSFMLTPPLPRDLGATLHCGSQQPKATNQMERPR